LVNNFGIIQLTSSSDHLPLTFDMLFDLDVSCLSTVHRTCDRYTKVKFSDLSTAILNNYSATVCKFVSSINLDNFEAIRCDNINCRPTQLEHIKQINCL